MLRRIRRPLAAWTLGAHWWPQGGPRGEALTLSITQSEPEPAGPSGIAGWLLLLVLKFWLEAGVRIAIGIGAVLAILDLGGISATSGEPGLPGALASIGAGLMAAITAVLLVRKSGSGPVFAKLLLLGDAGYYAWSMLNALHAPPPPVPSALPVWARPGVFGLASLAWFAYLFASQRVRNTYMGLTHRPVPEDDLTLLKLRSSRWEDLLNSGGQPPPSDEGEKPPGPPGEEPLTASRLELLTRRVDVPAAQQAEEPQTPEAEEEAEEDRPRERGFSEALRHGGAEVRPWEPAAWQPEVQAMEEPGIAAAWRVEEPEEPEERRQLEALKVRIEEGVASWLNTAENHPAGKAETLTAVGGEASSAAIQGANEKLVKQVLAICDHAWSVHVGENATLPNTPDAGGSLERELQKWAIAQAARRLTRSLDIRAAMEVNGPFERVIEDREYLLAIGERNAREEADKGAGLREYERSSGPEIAYMLILEAQRDMFEADMWVQVARLAGDAEFPDRFELAGSKTFQESRRYWIERLRPVKEDRAPMRPVGV